MIDSRSKYWGHIVATLALVQPWVWCLYKRYLRKEKVEIYETGTLEIGYSSFGATVGVMGTLRALHRDVFVRCISLVLVRLKDGSTHHLEWGIFRDQSFSSIGQPETHFELPYSFMLQTKTPRRFNIQFHDAEVRSEVRALTETVRQKWNQRVNEERDKMARESSSEVRYPSPEELTQFYSRFSNDADHVQAHAQLGRLCYWTPGTYRLCIRVDTASPERHFEVTRDSSLTDDDVALIRLNDIKILQVTCNQYLLGQWFFAFPEYGPSCETS